MLFYTFSKRAATSRLSIGLVVELIAAAQGCFIDILSSPSQILDILTNSQISFLDTTDRVCPPLFMANDPSPSVATSLIHYSSDDTVRASVLATFSAIAWYNAIELTVLCFVTFNRWHGCYFWSLLISSCCIITHCLGYVLLFFPTGVTPYVSATFVIISWYGMVTGQSMVLWSRLHLVLQNTRLLFGVLWMIIIDSVLLFIPTTVLLYGTIAMPIGVFARGYNIMERIQLVGFCIQELVISSLYIWETIKLLRLRPQGRPKGILTQLLIINIVILVLDIAIVVIEYAGYYALEVTFKPVAYSIKLKLEYAILGKLVAVAHGSYGVSQELRSSGHEINESQEVHDPPQTPGVCVAIVRCP